MNSDFEIIMLCVNEVQGCSVRILVHNGVINAENTAAAETRKGND